MVTAVKQPRSDFYLYPSVGQEDWRYAFATAKVRALETEMLSGTMLADMAKAASFEDAADYLSGGQYGLSDAGGDFGAVEGILLRQRSAVRRLFCDLIMDDELADLLRARDDFANLRLVLRRELTDNPIGTDYSSEGSVPAEYFEEVFEQESYVGLPNFMQEAIEKAVLAYYQDKDVRRIDISLDESHSDYRLGKAAELKSVFLTELFRMRIDLTNIIAMLRLKFTDSQQQDVFLRGGYVAQSTLRHSAEADYDALPAVFYSTPYYEMVESSVHYLVEKKSFLRVEYNRDCHINGYLDCTMQITAGPQPVIAYLLKKEQEIRMVRLILTAKRNGVDAGLILDRTGG